MVDRQNPGDVGICLATEILLALESGNIRPQSPNVGWPDSVQFWQNPTRSGQNGGDLTGSDH
jgi:hypothetical protein